VAFGELRRVVGWARTLLLAVAMATFGYRVWFGGVLSAVVALGVTACGDDDTNEAPGSAGTGGTGGKQSTGGQAGTAHAGTSAGDAGNGGSAGHGGDGGQAGETSCVDGLQVLKVVDASVYNIVSWPAEHRVAVNANGEGVWLYELNDDGEVTLLEKVSLEALGLTDGGSIYSLTRYGQGFLVHGVKGPMPRVPLIVNWQPDAELETIPLPEPLPSWFELTTADPETGIAAATAEGVRLATFEADVWSWSEPFGGDWRRSTPLAFENDRVLVGVQEQDRGGLGGAGNEGGGGAGGAGGEGGSSDVPTSSPQARIEWWSLSGQRLQTHVATGNPQVAVKVDEGWLIGETNSFWGSYRAGIELLPSEGALRKLTDVPVISAGDGTDGAYDLALVGPRLFVANCESGLLVGDWSPTRVTLRSLPGPWYDQEVSNCSPTQLEMMGDVLVLGGDKLVFARTCE
jgi:hypothetical protein